LTNRFDNRVFVIDKAVGPSSFDIVARVRRVTGLRRVGHAGTLDPLARGVLLVCTGLATRAVEHFMDLEKEYRFDIHLGVETATLDAEGPVLRETAVPDIAMEKLRAVAASFVGDYLLRFTRGKGGRIEGMLMSSGRSRGVRFERAQPR